MANYEDKIKRSKEKKGIKGNKPKPSVPIHWDRKFEDVLISADFQEKWNVFKTKVEKNQKLCDIEFELTDFNDLEITDLFSKDFNKFYLHLQDAIFKKLKNELMGKLRTKIAEKKPEEIHAIIDVEKMDLENRHIIDFAQDLTPYLEKYCVFHGKLANTLSKKNRLLEVEYQCSVCGTPFEILNRNIRCEKRLKPRECIKCSNKTFEEADIIGSKEIQHGFFKLADLEIRHYFSSIECRIFRNISYFDDKMDLMHLNEDVRVIGVLRTDKSALFEQGSIKKKDNPFYIEVIDVKSDREHKIDPEIIITLKEKLEKRPNYREMLIDAIFPFTWMIDLFLPPKLALGMSYVSGGSWNQKLNIRDSLNTIIGGGGSTFKSSLARNFLYILKDNEVKLHENRKITVAGLIGTTIRTPEGTTDIKFGVLPKYSNGTIIFDEAQELDFGVLTILRCLEKGSVGGIQDAIDFDAPVYESVVLVQNFMMEMDGYYNHHETLFQNLNWDKQNAKTLLDRFDLFCNISKPDKYTQLWIAENERRQDKEGILKDITEYLELDDYMFPNNITDLRGRIYYVLQNYFLKAKELYRNVDVEKEFKEYIRQFYEQAIRSGLDVSNDGIDITQRSKNTCYRVLKALACLRLDDKVNERDFDYFKLRAVNLITVFRNSKYFAKDFIDLDVIYVKTISDMFGFEQNPISIEDHISYMREYILRNTFKYRLEEETLPDEDILPKDIEGLKRLEEILPSETLLKKNYIYRKLLLTNREKLYEDHGIDTMLIRKKTHYIKNFNVMPTDPEKKDLLEKLKVCINEIFESIEENQADFKSLMQVITLDFSEHSEEEISYLIKVLIDLEEIDANKISNFHY